MELEPTNHGTSLEDHEESWRHWAVYSLKVVREYLPEEEVKTGPELAYEITGWTRSYRGAGQVFHNEPIARVTRSRVIVTQYGGLDI